MNKSELIDSLAEKADLSKAAAARAIDALIDTIVSEVAKGGEVSLVGFGKFASSNRAARTGRNPATGAELKIPASRVAKFTVGASFKETVAKTKPKAKKK